MPQLDLHWCRTHLKQAVMPFALYQPPGDENLPPDCARLVQLEWLGFTLGVYWRA